MDGCHMHTGLWDFCPCCDRDHAPAGPGAPWTDAMLADLGRAYRNHPDVADLIAGVRRVLALHVPSTEGLWRAPVVCAVCVDPFDDAEYPAYPCTTLRALNHPEESP
jgi:hypothetical protein